jgi:hypothetical protein
LRESAVAGLQSLLFLAAGFDIIAVISMPSEPVGSSRFEIACQNGGSQGGTSK